LARGSHWCSSRESASLCHPVPDGPDKRLRRYPELQAFPMSSAPLGPLSSAPLGPAIYHQEFRTTTAQPIPGDRRHWSISRSHEIGISNAWTQVGRNGVVIRRVVITRSATGVLLTRSFENRESLNIYFAGPNTISTEPRPGLSFGFTRGDQIVNPQDLVRLARHDRHDTVRSLGTVKFDRERLTALSLRVLRPPSGHYFGGYQAVRMYFIPRTHLLRAMDFGLLPAEPCRRDARQSRAACYRYASRPRPMTQTIWTLSREVPRNDVPSRVFRLGAPRHARWFNLLGMD
jgi:hypothetical protein